MAEDIIKLLYINDELATGDGSNSHALGMLRSFEKILGKENIRAFPQAEDGSVKPMHLNAGRFRKIFRSPLQIIRYFRKRYLSIKKSEFIIAILKNQGFVPSHVIARSTAFDTTAVYLAEQFNARLIYEINTPMYYECGVTQREPLIKPIEKWERQIMESSDFIYTVSSVCRDMLCEHYNLNHEKFLVIPNGYMRELYVETEEERKKIRNEMRRQEHLEGKYIIIFIGSLKIWHGIESLCETAKLLNNEKKIHFIVLGDGDGHDLISDYAKLHDNMLFKGKVSFETMKRYLYASDLGIMPYAPQNDFYFSPLKMFDMIGAGIPFIGTDVGQIKELCSEWKLEEMLIKNNEPSIIADAVYHWMEKDTSEVKNTIHCIADRVSWNDRAGELIQKIYQMS